MLVHLGDRAKRVLLVCGIVLCLSATFASGWWCATTAGAGHQGRYRLVEDKSTRIYRLDTWTGQTWTVKRGDSAWTLIREHFGASPASH